MSAIFVTVGQAYNHTPKRTTEVCRVLAEAGECTAFEKFRVVCRMEIYKTFLYKTYRFLFA